ncbi:uncharacterized protein VP01_1554g4 [Puccinia sorghi]|uniref:Uncharacterized protein n=1 Tax=Puccinia sorghi TaxID=27349 RepID=A0A0L6VJY9_9BASI|nr:uncharacterized protein VP01_1554g4 [Puccinia sorghi]
MLRRSRIPLNSTDPSILQDVVERQSTLHLQPSLTMNSISYSTTNNNSLEFIMAAPRGHSFSVEDPLTVMPQPRLKSLIKLEHLLRPSPSFRLGGPRRVASAPSRVLVHPPFPPRLYHASLTSLETSSLDSHSSVESGTSQSSANESLYSPATSGTSSSPPSQPLNLSTDSHPHRLSTQKPLANNIPDVNADAIEDYHPRGANVDPVEPFPHQAATEREHLDAQEEELPIKSVLPSPPSPLKKQYPPSNHDVTRAISRKDIKSPTLGSARKSIRRSESLKKIAPPHSFLMDAGGPRVPAEEEETPETYQRGGKVQGNLQERRDGELTGVQPINTKGLSAFIRPIKYGILQLSSGSQNPLKDKFFLHDQARLHVRLWLKDHHLLDPIPANLIVISPNGDKIELFHTALEMTEEEASTEELRVRFERAELRVLFYTLEALPSRLRGLYNYVRKFLMIMQGGVPRAVFQLHTLRFQQRVRCAIMMNDPQPDLELEWCELHLKLKLSWDRARIKLSFRDHIILHQHLPKLARFDDHLSPYLVTLLSDIFLSKQSIPFQAFHFPSLIHNHPDASLNLDRFHDFLDFIQPCLTISHQIQKSLNQF